MKRTNFIQRKESNKIISILTSIMVLMGVMIWTAPADAGRVAPVQKKVTSIKRTPLIGKSIGTTYTKPGIRKSSMRSTRSLGVDVNGGGSGGNPSMPGVSNQPTSNSKVNCINRYAPGVKRQKGCGCQDNKLTSLMTFNCKNPKPKSSATAISINTLPEPKLEDRPHSAAPTTGPTTTVLTHHVVCHYEWINPISALNPFITAIPTWEEREARGFAHKVCVNEPL